MSTEPDYKQLLINFLSSLSLCDHMGDVAGNAFKVIEQMGIDLPEAVGEVDKFFPYFAKHHNGTTVYGTPCDLEEYDEEYEYVG